MEQLYWWLRDIINFNIGDELLILFLVPTTIITLSIAYRWGLKKIKTIDYINDNDIVYFKTILKYQIIIAIITSLVWVPSNIKSIVLAPFYLTLSTLPLFIFFRIIRNKYLKNDKIALLSIRTQDDLNENIEKLLNSKNFLTALRSTLPRGEVDKEYGLDYIPYMLRNVDERRDRFSRRAKGFLITSIIAGTLFVSVTLYLGYILLDEDSISTGKVIRDIQSQTIELNKKISYISPETYAQIEEYKGINNRISSISDFLYTYNKNELKTQISSAFDKFFTSKDLKSLHNDIDKINLPYDSQHPDDNKLRRELKNLKYQIRDFITIKESAIRQVPQLVDRIEEMIDLSKQELSKTTNRTPDIIKRLILSLVIVSFFLTILRFLTNQYRNNFDQLIKSEEDDLYIRKTYIALKTAGDNTESKQIVLNQLLSRLENNHVNQKNESTENLSLAKELIETLAKKL